MTVSKIGPRLLARFPAAVLATGVVSLLAALASGCAEPPPVEEGELAPRFRAKTLDGASFDSQELEGRPALLNFWATWCRPCLKEIPVLQELDRGSEVRVIGIAIDEHGAETVAPFATEHAIRYTVVLGDQDLFLRFDGLVIPHSLLLDADLRIARVYRGPVSEERLERDIESLRAGS